MRNGIACAGNWIIDRVKFIDHWPAKGDLCSILSEERAPGGSPFSISIDLAKLKFPYPCYGLGCIGQDDSGAEVKAIASREGIDISMLHELSEESTSTTEVMTLQSSGERTFFHSRGANAIFGPEHISIPKLNDLGVKIFHLGYLLLLDKLDGQGGRHGPVAADVLEDLQKAGIETSVDIVSESSDRFQNIVIPCLPFIDHLIINEVEASRITGISIIKEEGDGVIHSIKMAAEKLLVKGVRQTVVIHFPEGSVMAKSNGEFYVQPSLNLPNNWILGSVGAGDAFCAGVLWGLHDDWGPIDTLKFASGVAAASLREPNSIDGVCDYEGTQQLISELGFRESW